MQPVIIHIHIPKCGGTSFRKYLAASFGDRHLDLYADRLPFMYTPETLSETVLRKPFVVSVSSHFIRLFPPILGTRPILYVTFLRDPVKHFLSYVTFIKKAFPGIVNQDLLRYLPQQAAEMSLREFTEWLLTRDAFVPFKENFVVNYLAEPSWSQISGYARPYCSYGTSKWDPVQFERYKSVRLDFARLILSSFFFVGMIEEMDGGMRYLRRQCSELGLTLSEQPVGRENVSSELLDDWRWVHPGDRVGAMLLDSLQEDFELYRWARARYQTAVFGRTSAAIKYDGQLVTAGDGTGPKSVYLVEHGCRRPVPDPGHPGVGPTQQPSAKVVRITEWELDEIPPRL